MKNLIAATLMLGSANVFAQLPDSALLPSATVFTGVAAISAPMVLLVLAASSADESLDNPTQTMPTVATSTAR